MIDGGSLGFLPSALAQKAAGGEEADALPVADVVTRFEAALNGATWTVQPGEGIGQLEALERAGRVDPTLPAIETPSSLGDKILQGVDRVRAEYKDTMAVMQERLTPIDAQPVGLQEMIRVHMEITRMTLQEELIGKIVGRSTQNVETLLKGQ
jgi:type III secretion protein I